MLARTGERWNRILEPTCGTGSFLRAAVDEFGSDVDIIGLDIQQEHLDKARASLAPDSALRLWKEDIFGVDLASLPWRADGGPTLVLGNPPWVTNSEPEFAWKSQSHRPQQHQKSFRNGRDNGRIGTSILPSTSLSSHSQNWRRISRHLPCW